jgi:hypothetical protein
MKAFRVGVFALVAVAAAFTARADVRTLDPVQSLTLPAGSPIIALDLDVAIDGGHIIVLGTQQGGHQALLYRRNNSDGKWVFRRVLVNWTGGYAPGTVAMKNGIAAVQFGEQVWLFEISGGDYVPATTAAPILHHGGLAISGHRLLVGGNNCDDDAVIYDRNTAGTWVLTGRIDDNQGECFGVSDRYDVELNYDYATLTSPVAVETKPWRRNGAALDWVPAGELALPPDELVVSNRPYAIQGATIVSSSGSVWRRSGSSTWVRQGRLTSVDHDGGSDNMFGAIYRDGVLISSEYARYGTIPKLYLESPPGHFEHVARRRANDSISRLDISGRTIVGTVARSFGSPSEMRVWTLPSQMRAPTPVVNDFEDRNISDMSFSGGQFALATRGLNDVLAQSTSNGIAIATVNDTDWTDYQRVEADITPTYGGSGSWVGLVARYVDANNYYYAVIRNNQSFAIYKRVNGVETMLYEANLYNTPLPTIRATMTVVGNKVSVFFSFQQGTTVTDNSLTHGRGGVITWFARADFDDVQVAGADPYDLFYREWDFTGNDYSSDMNELSGNWQVIQAGDHEEPYLDGLAQLDASGSAVAVIGTPVANQGIQTRMRLDSYAASKTGAWFGLLARYTDARNHYYVTVRASGQIDIRKIVNGVITVLATANYTAVQGQYVDVGFKVINDQLHLYLDNTLVLTAHDHDLASGQYGLATYRATARWATLSVQQP